jgi:hypothetical protein
MKAKIIALVVALTATITGVAAPNGYYNHGRINVDSSVIFTINKKHFNGVVVINNRRTDWDGCYTYEYYRPRYVTVPTHVVAYDRYGQPYVRTVYRRVLVR